MSTQKRKLTSSTALAKAYRRLDGHPVGALLVEDLAASREHGLVTARVGIGPDGNPIIYARDEAVAKRIGEAVQHQTAVHVRAIPPLDVSEFRMLSRQAERALGVPAASTAPSPLDPDQYQREVESTLVERFGVQREEAAALARRYQNGVEQWHSTGKSPESAAEEIRKRRAGGA